MTATTGLRCEGAKLSRVKVHIDTDFAGDTDDACAVALILGAVDVELTAVTTVADPDGMRAGYLDHFLRVADRDVPTERVQAAHSRRAGRWVVYLITRRTGATRTSHRDRGQWPPRSSCSRAAWRPAPPSLASALTRTWHCSSARQARAARGSDGGADGRVDHAA